MNSIKKISIVIIIALVVGFIIIFEPFSTEPPVPDVSVNDSEIPTTQGSYCWFSIFAGKCEDYIYTTPLEMAEEHKPTVVSPNDEVKIKFGKEPIPGTLEVEKWIDENNIESIKLENNIISAPKEKGIYVYHIIAKWDKGDGNFAFSIEVK